MQPVNFLAHVIRTTGLVIPLALAGITAAHAAGPLEQARHAQERETCAQRSDPDSRAACVREIGAARQAARSGDLTSLDAPAYAQNALQRCAVFKVAEDRADCEARLRNPISGSVDGGGLLRETRRTYTLPQ